MSWKKREPIEGRLRDLPMPDILKIRWRERLLEAGVSIEEAARVLETSREFIVTGDGRFLEQRKDAA